MLKGCSWVCTSPVSRSFVGSKHLLTELLVSTILNCVNFKSVWVTVYVVILCKQVRDRIHCAKHSNHHHHNNTLVRNFILSQESDVFRNIMCHLRSWCWSAIFIFNHAIMKLRGHSNNHVIVVRIEITTLWNIQTEWRSVVEASKQVVRIVRQTWRMGCSLCQIRWPNALVSILGLMYRHIWCPNSVMDLTLTIVPFLEVITFVFLMAWMDFWKEYHSFVEFSLSETLINKQIVLLMHGTMAALTGSAEDLKTSAKTKKTIV